MVIRTFYATNEISLVLKNALSEIEGLTAEIEEFAFNNKLPPKTIFDLTLSLEEIVTNIVSYAYGDGGEREIIVDMNLRDGTLEVSVRDDGKPFNPLLQSAPDTQKPLEEREIGGLGIHLVRRLMDELHYRRERDHNMLTLRKKILENDR